MKTNPPKDKEGIKEQVDKLLNIKNLIDEGDYYQGIDVNKLDVLSDKLVALFQKQVKEIIKELPNPGWHTKAGHLRAFQTGGAWLYGDVYIRGEKNYRQKVKALLERYI